MELLDALKIFGGVLGGALIHRAFKGTDDLTALKVEVATLKERLEAYSQRLTTVDNRAAAAFTKIDKVRSRLRADSGKGDPDGDNF